MVLKVKTTLPLTEDLNFLSEAKYIASKDEIQMKQLPKSDVKIFYTEILNQLTLRTLHEIFESEYKGHVQRIEFHAVSEGTDLKTGQQCQASILELGVERSYFVKIDLSKIDPEPCLDGMGCKFYKPQQLRSDKVA